jgi:hypothetical protein
VAACSFAAYPRGALAGTAISFADLPPTAADILEASPSQQMASIKQALGNST